MLKLQVSSTSSSYLYFSGTSLTYVKLKLSGKISYIKNGDFIGFNSNDELLKLVEKDKITYPYKRYNISENEIKEAEKIDQMLQPLHKSLFIESNPAPTKYAAKLLGLCSDEIRLPLVNIKKETEEEVEETETEEEETEAEEPEESE